jgi:hypothetical protein
VKHSSPENRDKQGCATLNVYLYNATRVKKEEKSQLIYTHRTSLGDNNNTAIYNGFKLDFGTKEYSETFFSQIRKGPLLRKQI